MNNPINVNFDVRKSDNGDFVCEVKLYDQVHHFIGKDPSEAVGKGIAFLGKENVAKVEVAFRNT